MKKRTHVHEVKLLSTKKLFSFIITYTEKDFNRKKGELCETKREGKQRGTYQIPAY